MATFFDGSLREVTPPADLINTDMLAYRVLILEDCLLCFRS